jgi:hypothetical protein
VGGNAVKEEGRRRRAGRKAVKGGCKMEKMEEDREDRNE